MATEETNRQPNFVGDTLDKRKKQLAIIKAQNEMLEQSIRDVEERFKDDPSFVREKTQDIRKAIDENIAEGAAYLQATPEDINNAQYHDANEHYKDVYRRRLEMRGMTDEEMRQKSADGDTAKAVAKAKTKPKSSKKAKTEKKKSIAEVIENAKGNENTPVIKPFVEENNDSQPKPRKIKQVVPEVVPFVRKDSYKPFDPSTVPDYVQYDIVPLPSKGQCYPHKKASVPVAYITASDENLIVSPNLYRDGKLTDMILKRKILDKDFDVDQMCQGDKDAIVLWLRANAYGDEFPVTTRHPDTRKEYRTTLHLSDFLDKYKEFDLVGDENGYFDYTLSNGDNIKFRFVPAKELAELKSVMSESMSLQEKTEAYRLLSRLDEALSDINDEDWQEFRDDVADMRERMGELSVESDMDDSGLYSKAITEEMCLQTMSVNGNSDREYVRNYVENMRAKDAMEYRRYMNRNQPGVDLTITIEVPESDGGGSYDSFLRLDEYVFLNVQ